MKQLLSFLFAACILGYSCNNSHQYEISSKDNDKYESGKEQLGETEKKFPSRFLKASGSSKKNLLGQTVVRGTIYNNAKIISYKDIDIKLSFYSKTRALLEEDHEMVYETIEPGGGKSFKSKYFAPKGTDSVALTVVSAKN